MDMGGRRARATRAVNRGPSGARTAFAATAGSGMGAGSTARASGMGHTGMGTRAAGAARRLVIVVGAPALSVLSWRSGRQCRPEPRRRLRDPQAQLRQRGKIRRRTPDGGVLIAAVGRQATRGQLWPDLRLGPHHHASHGPPPPLREGGLASRDGRTFDPPARRGRRTVRRTVVGEGGISPRRPRRTG